MTLPPPAALFPLAPPSSRQLEPRRFGAWFWLGRVNSTRILPPSWIPACDGMTGLAVTLSSFPRRWESSRRDERTVKFRSGASLDSSLRRNYGIARQLGEFHRLTMGIPSAEITGPNTYPGANPGTAVNTSPFALSLSKGRKTGTARRAPYAPSTTASGGPPFHTRSMLS